MLLFAILFLTSVLASFGGELREGVATTVPGDESARLEKRYTGPGIIDFWLVGGNFNSWSVSLDGEELDLSQRSWPHGFRIDGDGEHVVVFEFENQGWKSQEVTLTDLIFLPDKPVSLEAALDVDGLQWEASGDEGWVGSPYFSRDGHDAAWCGGLLEGESALLEAEVEGPAVVSFWWRTTTGSLTEGEFFVNGSAVEAVEEPARSTWRKVYFVVGVGTHRIGWRAFETSGSLRESPARGLWIDEFQVKPFEEFSLAGGKEGTWIRGEVIEEEGSLTVDVKSDGLAWFGWKIEESNQPRKVVVEHLTETTVRFSSGRADGYLEGGDDWVSSEFLVPPGVDEVVFRWASWGDRREAKIRSIRVEDVANIPLEEVAGAVGEYFRGEGWYGDPESEDGKIFAFTSDASVRANLKGPAILRFEAPFESYFHLNLNDEGLLTSARTSTGKYEYHIPAGTHELEFHAVRGFAHISKINIEQVGEIAISNALGLPSLSFVGSGTNRDRDTSERWPLVESPFYADSEGVVRTMVLPGQDLSLATRVSGPAILGFERRLTGGAASGPPPITGTGVHYEDYAVPRGDPGTSLWVNEGSYFHSGGSGLLVWSGGRKSPPTEPFDSSIPGRVGAGTAGNSQGSSVALGRSFGIGEYGWEKIQLYLGPGEFEIDWRVGVSHSSGRFRYFELANLQVTAVLAEYSAWAESYWTANEEVANSEVKLSSWHDPDVDPDQDGFSNRHEFFFQTDPRDRADFPMTARFLPDQKGVVQWPAVPFGMERGRMIPEGSRDLRNWFSSEDVIQSEMTPAGLQSWGTEGEIGARFFRLGIDLSTE